MSSLRGPAPLCVVFDLGAAAPAEVGMGITKIGPMVTLLGSSGYAQSMRPLLEQFGAVMPLADSFDDVVTALKDIGVRGVLTFSERMQLVTARLAQALGLPGHSAETVQLLTDKFAQRQRLSQAGVAAVRCRLLRQPADWPAAVAWVGLPAVLKPAAGEGSRNTFRITVESDGADLVRCLLSDDHPEGTREDALVVEEFLAGRETAPLGDYVSVECAAAGGHVWPLAVTGKLPLLPPFRETGQFWPALLPPAEMAAVRDLAVDAVRALGVTTGVTHTEIKLTEAGPRLIEVNGRLGGHQPDLAMRAAGLDMVEIAGRVALGEVPAAQLPELDRVYFQYWSLAPQTRCLLEEVRGAEDVRRLPGVTTVRHFIRPGAELPGSVGSAWLGQIAGEAPDHTAMLAILDQIQDKLSYVFRTADGRIAFSAAGLCR